MERIPMLGRAQMFNNNSVRREEHDQAPGGPQEIFESRRMQKEFCPNLYGIFKWSILKTVENNFSNLNDLCPRISFYPCSYQHNWKEYHIVADPLHI